MEQELQELREKVKKQAAYIEELEAVLESVESDVNDAESMLDGIKDKLKAFYGKQKPEID